MEQPSAVSLLARRWRALDKSAKWAFFACFCAGLLIHLFAFTNIIPNSDGISRVNDPQQMSIVGRWFLHYATWFNAYTQMPQLIGVLSCLFLSLAAALTVRILRFRQPLFAAFAGVLMAAVPAMAYTYLYMFTASAYCFAILLAVLSVWLTERFRCGWLWGSAVLALSVGIYQAYVTVAITLCLMLVLRYALDNPDEPRRILCAGLKKVAFLCLGMAIYYGILQIFLYLKDLELLNYLNMDDTFANYPLARLPRILLSTYAQFVRYYFTRHGYTGLAMVACYLVLAALLLLTVLQTLRRAPKCSNLSVLMVIGMLALLPLAVNFTQVLSPSSSPTPLMQYSFVLPLVFALALLPELKWTCARLSQGCELLTLAALLLLTLKYAQTDNLCYTASAQAHRATESFCTRLVGRIEAAEGYTAGMEVCIIGGYPDEYYDSTIASFEAVLHYSCLPTTVTPLNKQIYYYLNKWLNVPIAEPAEQTLIAVAASEAFAAMPLYPSDGSVQISDGRVIVKLAESYTPKQAYEIAYESRR